MAIIDVTDSDFNLQVIRRSYKTAVLVDFWAAWCGPCRVLGPTLEKIAEDPSSEFILAKLNTEHNPRTAGQFQIRSIPNVKAFRNGQVVNEFMGAIPSALVKRFITKVMEAPAPQPRMKIHEDPEKRLQQAIQHLKKGRGFEAFILLRDFPESGRSADAARLYPLASFIVDMEDGDGLTGIDDLDNAYLATLKSLKKGKPSQALDKLFSAFEIGEEIDESYTRGVIESIMDLFGENADLMSRYQERLATL